MSYQVNRRNRDRGESRNKRGVSVIIGYILLVAIVVAISVGVYTWMKSYVPQDALQCPDGVSVSIPDYTYDCATNQLNLSIQNSGTFSIAGYFIKATNNSGLTLATIDLTPYYHGTGSLANNAILFSSYLSGLNSKDPGAKVPQEGNTFSIPSYYGKILRIEITPARYVTYNNKIRFATCGNAIVSERLSCS